MSGCPRLAPFGTTTANRVSAVFGLLAAAAVLHGQTFTTLFAFDGSDGMQPNAGLVQGTDGNLYGTTYGTNGVGGPILSRGTVFKITPSGALTTLHVFCARTGCLDGAFPAAGLVQGADGSFYGTTSAGGSSSSCSSGCGTVFKITPSGTLTTLWNFDGTGGSGPAAALVQGIDGDFYGTTEFGGVGCGGKGCGTVFKITPSDTLTTLHVFDGQNGVYPYGGLFQATNGYFYGTTLGGGTGGSGAIFKMTPSGTLTTLLSFDGSNGSSPLAGLVQGTDGYLYGTTSAGGANTSCSNGCGTVFRMTSSGLLATLVSFDGSDGQAPEGALFQATDGNFYGATNLGGTTGSGTLFKITPNGELTTLYSFGGASGKDPAGGLVQATNGEFYGATVFGGGNSACYGEGCGAVFSLSAGLSPFVKLRPASGSAGTIIDILGSGFTLVTSVKFNGTAAAFTLVSPSEIQAEVPIGATSGTVVVTTPTGTLSSNKPFTIVK